MNSGCVGKVIFGSLVYGAPGVCAFLSLAGVRNTVVDLCSAWFVIAMAMTVFVYLALFWSESNRFKE